MDEAADPAAAPIGQRPANSERSYGDWKAPAADGELLIWPEPPDLLRDALDNNRRLGAADSVLIQNLPLPEVRRRLRQVLGVGDDATPLIATGHQTELHHPGVWVKNALIDAAATKLSGQALHFAVDTDAPKHLLLRWPEAQSPGGPVTAASEPLTDDAARTTDAWSGRLDPPTPAHIAHLAERFESAAAGWSFRPMVGEFLISMRRLALESVSLSSALTNALHELDWKLGLRHGAMVVSPLCISEPYLAFAHHVLARADRFAGDYNSALDEYRRRHKIRAPGRPMPNLRCEADLCEVPFWLDDLTAGSRSRAHVFRGAGAGRWSLVLPRSGGPERSDESEVFEFDPAADGWEAAAALLAWLRRHSLRLSPRALTLTSVLRLLAADQFVHGIGGGQYDQVADALVARHLGLEPPRFAVTTATLYFPGAAAQSRACVPCVLQEGHRLKHGILGERKSRLVEAIAAAPRRSIERQTLFHDLHHQLADAAGSAVWRSWEQRLLETQRREAEERVLFDRELFYAIQPAERLERIIQRYRSAMS